MELNGPEPLHGFGGLYRDDQKEILNRLNERVKHPYTRAQRSVRLNRVLVISTTSDHSL